MEQSKQVTIRDSTMSENSAGMGGCVYVEYGDLKVYGTTISHNKATHRGAG